MSDASSTDPAMDEIRPEFRDDAGDGDLGAEETAPAGMGAGSGTGGGHDYPGRAGLDDAPERPGDRGDGEGPDTDSPRPADEQDQPAPERPPDEGRE